MEQRPKSWDCTIVDPDDTIANRFEFPFSFQSKLAVTTTMPLERRDHRRRETRLYQHRTKATRRRRHWDLVLPVICCYVFPRLISSLDGLKLSNAFVVRKLFQPPYQQRSNKKTICSWEERRPAGGTNLFGTDDYHIHDGMDDATAMELVDTNDSVTNNLTPEHINCPSSSAANQLSSSSSSPPGLPYLMKTVLKLQEKEWGSVRFVTVARDNENETRNEIIPSPSSDLSPSESFSNLSQNDRCHINSIVFSVQDNTSRPDSSSNVQYVLAVLSSKDRVNMTKLEQAVIECYHTSNDDNGLVGKRVDTSVVTYADQRTPSVFLAPSDRLPYLCGFESGTIPPIGLVPSPVMTLVDQSLVDAVRENSAVNDHAPEILVAGGGRYGQRLELSLDVLLDNAINVHIKDIRDKPITTTTTASAVAAATGGLDNKIGSIPSVPSVQTLLRGHEKERIPKPFFVVEPPDTARVKQILSKKESGDINSSDGSYGDNDDNGDSLYPEWVSVVGRISGVRQMARRLVFADLAPPVVSHRDPSESDDHPWRQPNTRSSSGEHDDDSMAVQLIFGKTLIQRLGVDDGEAALRRIKPGMLVLIQGKTNVGNKDSLQNWIRKQSLDVVVFEYQVMLTESSLLNTPSATHTPTRFPIRSIVSNSMKVPVAPAYRSQSSLPALTMTDIYGNIDSIVHLVDDLNTLQNFKRDITTWLEQHPDLFALVGVDSEWKPNFLASEQGEAQPVLLLQLCFHPMRRVYLLDLQSLTAPDKKPDDPLVDSQDILLSEALSLVFTSPRLIKVGYQVLNDLQKLAGSYPHLEGVERIESILECSKFALKTMQMTRQPGGRVIVSSLSRLVEHMIPGKSLDKTEQVSDWSRRPLQESQLQYASLDAAVLPYIVERLMELVGCQIYSLSGDYEYATPQLGRWEDDKAFRSMIQSSRFLFIDGEIDRQAAKRLRAKKVVSGNDSPLIATQTWKTGDEMPGLPTISSAASDSYTDLDGIVRVPSTSLSVRQMDGDGQDCIEPYVGNWGAKNKQGCIRSLVELGYGDDESIPLRPDEQIEFPQRSGIAELKNAVVLFITLPMGKGGRGGNRNYPNEWLEDGSLMSWFLRENEWKDGTSDLARKLVSSEASADKLLDPLVLLFVRRGKDNFYFCGRCQVVHLQPKKSDSSTDESSSRPTAPGIVKLFLLLKDWSKLQQLEDFNDLVKTYD